MKYSSIYYFNYSIGVFCLLFSSSSFSYSSGKDLADAVYNRDDGDNSAYSKKVNWINIKTLLAVKIEFYQNGETKPFKQLLVKKIKKVQGIWTVMESVIKDLKSSHETHLQIKSIFYNKNIPSELFSKKYLTDPSREKEVIHLITQ